MVWDLTRLTIHVWKKTYIPLSLAICTSLCTSRRLQEELDAENRIKNRLPVLSNFLMKMIPQWEAAQSEPFLFKGER